MRLNAERLRSRLTRDDETSEMVEEINEDLERLRQIIESLLFLAKVESGSFAPTMQRVQTAQVVADFAEDAVAMAEERGITFTVTRSDEGSLKCEATLVRQLLLNLVSNAVRVVPRGGGIYLASTVTAGQWRIEMTDDGPGLTDEQLSHVFERFVRFGRSDEEPGHGLGLAICRSIALLHGGKLDAYNRKERSGLRMVLELPLMGPGSSTSASSPANPESK